MNSFKNRSGVTGAIGITMLVCLSCLFLTGFGWYAYSMYDRSPQTNGPVFVTPFELAEEPELMRPPVDATSAGTLFTLENTVVPTSDSRELLCRLDGNCNVPEVIATSAVPRVVGEVDDFWVHNLDTEVFARVRATLRYVTPHAYFWVQDGVSAEDAAIQALMDAFETKMYPTNREFFGSEWSPGIDGDEHIYILYARGLGFSIAGYFSSSDSAHPWIHEYSNGHEMFLFNADNTPLVGSATYGVLAHEFQHMIHWYNDLNETSWLNEGASELAAFINGYSTGGSDRAYLINTDVQLNDWPNEQGGKGPHYGASFLFMTYFLDRFGEDATRALVRNPANGMDSVDAVLKEIGAADPLTGQPITADTFFLDWAIANFLLDGSVGDGRYLYTNFPAAQRAYVTETIDSCPRAATQSTVHQYGVDYIAIKCEGEHTIHFTGSTIARLLPVNPYSGEYAFWSNKGDESDMTLTREFDFTDISAPIELSFRTWYDIESDWDYVYVEVSEDGESWDILLTPSGTGSDPSGNSFGWGYTGVTGDWIEETIDLSEYAGRKIFIRFEYITDSAVNGEGFMVDDVSVEATGYRSDFEADDGGWTAEGFVRIQNVLPQTFGLALIRSGDTSVTMIPLNPDATAEIPVSLQRGQTAYLIVTGTTRFTRELASYQIEIK